MVSPVPGDAVVAYLHRIVVTVDRVNARIGRAVAWIILVMVTLQFAIVVLRYVFGVGYVMVQESMIYMHATVILMGAGYTLLHDEHVRVDIFYRSMPARRRAAVDLFGVVVFLFPLCAAIVWVGLPYVAASWSVLEGSPETSGIPGVFLLKSLILVLAALLALQGLALGLRSLLALAGRPPPRPAPHLAERR